MPLQPITFSACKLIFLGLLLLTRHLSAQTITINSRQQDVTPAGRERISLNGGWRFFRSTTNPDGLSYDSLKTYMLPSANNFIKDASKRYQRPSGNPGSSVSYVQKAFNDTSWTAVTLPHDWAIKGPFYTGSSVPVGGGMGRLPVQGVGWYRRKLSITAADAGKTVYLDIDGAMSYAAVWVNGNFVGGWPYGYSSFRLDLTPYLQAGDDNQVAIRLDNPTDSSRWYPGAGIYRNVWLVKVDPVHVAQWGTYITTKDVSAQSATVSLVVQVENRAAASKQVEVATDVYTLDQETGQAGDKVAEFPRSTLAVPAGQIVSTSASVSIKNPRLWGPPPQQQPNLYVAVTRLTAGNGTIDTYDTRFGVRTFTYDANQGLLVNGQHIRIQGVNQHHDLGAIGSAFNLRAAERQLQVLQDMGANAIRTSHNPPAPELLDMTDRMGFLVLDEIFDCWERQKTANDFHLIFSQWSEPDLRSFVRRDRNHPSIFAWSFGNEVGEQTTAAAGAAIGQRLHDMVREEDATRPSTASMNQAQPGSPFANVLDLIALNYQGEGIRDTPAYSQTSGIKTKPLYPDFHSAYPGKLIFSSETAAALSTRGTYLFPVTSVFSAPVNDSSGGDSVAKRVSAYELYSADFGSSADKVFKAQDGAPFVAGEFVWSGWDYLGEPTPYYSARSSYFGPIDLAGFRKDRFYLYQSRWRPDVKSAHILPHWNWPNRVGQVTPVHVFTSADEAELFVNGKSQGRKKQTASTYRFRWDSVTYQAGEVRVVTYKNGQEWATETVRTTGTASQLRLTADRSTVSTNSSDLLFITAEVLDSKGDLIRNADNAITFSVSGPGEIIATDNGDPADMTAFPSKQRKAFSGLALAIVQPTPGLTGTISISATGSSGSSPITGSVTVQVQ